MPNDSSNPPLKSDDCILWKITKSAILMSEGPGDLSYSASQSAGALSWDSPAVSENNTDCIDNFWEKLI